MSVVLVTGAAGFLGSWIADELRGRGYGVLGVDNLPSGGTSKQADILDLQQMVRITKGCDYVVHCAALPYEGLSVFSPSLIADNITTGTINVAVAAINAGVKRFVNCSSMARYGFNYGPYAEWMEPNPVDPYGIAKVAAEQQLNVLGKVHGMKVVHAVPHNIYGPRQNYTDPFRNVAAIFANQLLQDKQPTIYGDGQQTRCFSWIGDVVPMFVKLLEEEIKHGEVFNVGPDDGEVTINHLLAILTRLTEYKGPDARYLPSRPCEVKYATCSAAKIRSWFGYKSTMQLKEGLKQLVEYIRERGPAPFNYNLPLEIINDNTPKPWVDKDF